jgi:cytochrome P450
LYAGLTNMNGAQHRRQRKLMGAVLRRRYVAAYGPEVTAIAQRQFARWRVGTQLDMLLEMCSLTMAIAVSTMLRLPRPRRAADDQLLQDCMAPCSQYPRSPCPACRTTRLDYGKGNADQRCE